MTTNNNALKNNKMQRVMHKKNGTRKGTRQGANEVRKGTRKDTC